MRKKRRHPGCARLISWYCAMTGEAGATVTSFAAGEGVGRGRGSSFIVEGGDGGRAGTFQGSMRPQSGDMGHEMSEARPSFPVIREAVASFADREHFRRAVSELVAAGFEPSALSVLATHESLAAVGEQSGARTGLLP